MRETYATEVRTYKHFHFFCGLGGGAEGFNQGRGQIGNMRGQTRCFGGIDNDPAAIRDFTRRTGVVGTCRDLFDLEQYIAFHGRKPPAGWTEAMPDDIRRAAGGEFPDIVFLSAPCKGFSGLLAESKSKTGKYQALNRLTLRGVWLMLEAFKDNPPGLIIFENVPRIATRGRALLDQITALYRHYGYAVAETTHDCGEIGGLAESRKRFLMVARHVAKVPAFLYEPDRKPLKAVGEILGQMPMPGDPIGGPMHAIPKLHWKTWVRLAFVEAGSDWRSLNKLKVVDGNLADYLSMPESAWAGSGRLGVGRWDDPAGTIAGASRPENGRFSIADVRQEAFQHAYGVNRWQDPAHTVQGKSAPSNGMFAVADPSIEDGQSGRLGVCQWDESMGTVAGESLPSNGKFSVADPRMKDSTYPAYGVLPYDRPAGTITSQSAPGGGMFAVADPGTGHVHHQNVYRVTRWDSRAHTVTGSSHTAGGAPSVADPRPAMGAKAFGKFAVAAWDGSTGTVIGGDDSGAYAVADPGARGAYEGRGKYKVTPFGEPAGTIIAESGTGNGGYAVADPRAMDRQKGDSYLTGGHYGVVPWDGTTGAVSSAACHDNGAWSVADPRWVMPAQSDNLVCVIRSLDGTWHRPFTTAELAAIQGLLDPLNMIDFDGTSDSAKRERIGNAVPPPAAKAIADLMVQTLLLADSGETFILSEQNIWVQPVAVALAVHIPTMEEINTYAV